ncbi:MAG: polysaccharide deacetylase family protein, partial [Anaerolineales bacterium]
ATFFMVGEPAERFPEIVRRAGEAGHALGVHGWDHPAFPLLTSAQRRQQIQRCAKVLAPYGQCLFRPPYGYQTFASRLDAWRLGYRVVGWSAAGHDWLDHTADQIMALTSPQLQPGVIVVLHDVLYHTLEPRYADRRPMLAAVEALLTQLGSQYQFVTVPELRRHGRAQQSNWYRPPDAQWLNRLQGQYGPVRRYAVTPAEGMNAP